MFTWCYFENIVSCMHKCYIKCSNSLLNYTPVYFHWIKMINYECINTCISQEVHKTCVFFFHPSSESQSECSYPIPPPPPSVGWLVDTTGTYTATFFLSGFALISSSLVISTVTGIRHCRRTQKHRNKNKNIDPKQELCRSDFYTASSKDVNPSVNTANS